MSRRSPEAFRFAPPRLAASPELAWALTRAFAGEPVALARPNPDAARALAVALGVAPRIAARTSDERLAAELGSDALAPWRRIRAQAAAIELRLDAALAAADAVCAGLGIPYALLKGRALALGGLALPAARPASDVDLLVPEAKLAALQRALASAGFRRPASAGYEHQAPLLVHSGGGALELHRTIPGVRLEGRRSATFAALERAERLERPPAGVAGGPGLRGDARWPAREVLIAHALVHTLAQHAFVPAHSGLSMVADLLDLGCASVTATEAAVGRWIARDVSARELRAALELVDTLAAGDLEPLRADRSDAGRLAAHFVACARDRAYAESLKLRFLEAPVADRPLWWARLALLARTAKPTVGSGPLAWLGRPFDLARRWRSARRARRPGGS